MKVKKMLVIEEDGISEMITVLRPLGVDSEVINKLSQSVTRKIPNVFMCQGLGVHAIVGDKLTAFTADLTYINLTTRFAINANKELYACFDSSSAPVMTMKWEAPPGLYLSLVVLCPSGRMEIQGQFIVATADLKTLYRLPLPNLYENSSLCSGKFDMRAVSYQELVEKSVNQFHNSPWNTDLMGRGKFDSEGPLNLFKFKPSGTNSFEQINDTDWKKWSTVVSDATLQTYYYHAN